MKRRRMVGSVIGLAALILAAVWLFALPNTGRLPRDSVRIASVIPWADPTQAKTPLTTPIPYFWTTYDDLIRAQRLADGSSLVLRARLNPDHTLTPASTSPVHLPAGTFLASPSPDGSHLLSGRSSKVFEDAFRIDVHLLTAEGKDDHLLPAMWAQNMVWMPDGKSWIVSYALKDVLSTLDGKPFRLLETTALSEETPYVLGVDAQGQAIATIGGEYFEEPAPSSQRTGRNYPDFAFLAFDPNLPDRNPRRWKVTVPPQTVRGSVLLSPHAERILWIVEKQSSLLAQWKARLHPQATRSSVGEQALFVSRLDGSEMRELCSLPLEEVKWGRNTIRKSPLANIRWLADGKRISFTYKNALYIAPVN